MRRKEKFPFAMNLLQKELLKPPFADAICCVSE